MMSKTLSHKQYTHYLEQVTELFSRYLELLKEPHDEKNSKQWLHKLIELRAEMNHLKASLEEAEGNEAENKKKFLAHHKQATEQALELRTHIIHHLDNLISHELELETVHQELENILQALEAHKLSHQNHETPTPFRSFYGPTPSPLPPHKKEDK